MICRHRALAALLLGALTACSTDPVGVAAPTDLVSTGVGVDSVGSAEPQHLVVFGGTTIPAGFEAQVTAQGGRVLDRFAEIGVAVVAGLDGAGVTALRGVAGVSLVDVNPVLSLPSVVDVGAAEAVPMLAGEIQSPGVPTAAAFYARQWNLRAIGADRAWAAGRRGSPAVSVFILDTGLDYTHPDLVGRVDLARSRSFVGSDNAIVASRYGAGVHPVADLHYHGTHVGATVSSNAVGAAGVTSQVTLVGVKVLDVTGRSVGSSVLSGMMYAANADADIVNLSLGSWFEKDGNGAFVEAVNRVTNYMFAQGTLTIVAAGNESRDLDHDRNGFQGYCSASNVLCVSATGPVSAAGLNGPWVGVDEKAPYTNYGRSEINVGAPGGSTGGGVSAACSRFSQQMPQCQGGSYVIPLSGTSMAAPHVAGMAALLVETVGRNRPAQLRAAIAKAADDLGQPGRDPVYGSGRINIATALGLR